MVSKRLARIPSSGLEQLPQEVLDKYKRERVVHAVAEIAADLGLARLTVDLVTKRAKMARATFYELFDSREAAVRHAVEHGNRKLREAVDRAADQEAGWEGRVRSAIDALLAETAAAPALAELCLLQGCSVNQGSDGPFDPGLIEALAGVLRAGRRERGRPSPGPRTEELLACGILATIAKQLRRGEVDGPRLEAELTRLATMPFLASDHQPGAPRRAIAAPAREGIG